MRIAICDDESSDLLYIKGLLRKFASEIPVDCFSSSRSLLSAFETVYYPLIFLDIEMEEPSGFSVAEQLMNCEQRPLIIFVTKSTAYSVRGYDVAFHYLVKPVQEEKLKQVLDRALQTLTPHFFSFSSEGMLYRIPLNEIIFFESQNYSLLVHTATQTYKTRFSLKEVESDLSNTDFFRIHASYIVNLDHISRISRNDVEMDSGNLLKVSRAHKKAFDNAFINFTRRTV